jgi:2-polyprenyl-3-methyl-5-hydroxy-6-metoxy-1,4-benzoquinol methylase
VAVTVAEIDKRHLEVIRRGVESFIEEMARKFDRADALLLDVAPQIYHGAKACFSKATVRTLDINPASKADFIADLCEDNSGLIRGSSFDFVLCTEVLEHTVNPFAAVNEIYRILKTDGLLFLTTPFNFRIHGPLPDCWRFTEHGLRTLLARYEVQALREVPTPERPLMPIHYWVVARKIAER